MKKAFNIGKVFLEMYDNGFPKGFILKRDLTYRECSYILKNLLGISHITKEDCFDEEEWKSWRDMFIVDVNKWLSGEREDDYIMQEYTGDCGDEPIGIMNLIPIISYLKKKKIIE